MTNARVGQTPGSSVHSMMYTVAVALLSTALVSGCGATTPPSIELKLTTTDFNIRMSPESRPTRALEPTYWRVVVHDKKTGTPIQGGQGRIFATNHDKKSIANGLSETGELGTYRTNLMFVTAGMWAMGLQFRRDSTLALQRTEDWTQDILSADEPGNFATPQSARAPEPTTPPLPAPASTKKKEP